MANAPLAPSLELAVTNKFGPLEYDMLMVQVSSFASLRSMGSLPDEMIHEMNPKKMFPLACHIRGV